jgi:hypothetical protein
MNAPIPGFAAAEHHYDRMSPAESIRDDAAYVARATQNYIEEFSGALTGDDLAKVADHMAGEMTNQMCVDLFEAYRLNHVSRVFKLVGDMREAAIKTEAELRAENDLIAI